MKIQDMAIIFVLIILPISLVLSAYAQYQIQTLNTQTLYDTQLTAATYDAIKAYQINAENSTTSELSNSKVRDIEASVSTFKNSIMSAFRLNGYSEEELNNYIPALVYTMYDGFYIYSPYENVNHQVDEAGNKIQGNGENIYGLKPYIPYSCRYKKGSIDVIITYALDNYITVQGTIDGTNYVNESGYLVDGITVNTSTNKIFYNGIEIKTEKLKEYLIGSSEHKIPAGVYQYVKINGTKYYLIGDQIIYLSNGTPKVQCKNTGNPNDEFSKYKNLIENNNQAIQYYKNAKEFTDKVRSTTGLNLLELTYGDAYDVDGNTKLWPGNETKIFTGTTNIENELSNFNQHRLGVIRHTIESNLSLAIANYNKYSKSTTNDFQMPKLKEDEWDYITHNISLISFLQGLNIGGKMYNGYTIVTNSESKEVVLEPNIYILGKDGDYHKIGDKTIEGSSGASEIGDSTYGEDVNAGRLNLDFKRKSIIENNNTKYYYPLQQYDASYKSIVMQDKVTSYNDIYAYVNLQSVELKEVFYTALGRERQGQYKSNYMSIKSTTSTTPNNSPYIPTGFTQVAGTNLNNGFTVQDSKGNQYVWVEVPKTTEVYPTAGLSITAFTDDEYTAIENDLHTYTNVYRKSGYTDTYYSDDVTGLTSTQYAELKQKMLKSVYKNGGFYVGKYETGIEDAPKTSGSSYTAPTQTPVIKQNAYPYNYVTCKQAQTLASNMPSGEYTSSLMFGVQWDLVLKYLETKGATQDELNSDSTNWGNYDNNNWTISNANSKYYYNSTWTNGLYNGTGSKGNTSTSILLSTGASDEFSKQGIYDLAGNVKQWTLEKTPYTRWPGTSRGGGWNCYGYYESAGDRSWRDVTENYSNLGFRVALY